MKTKKRNSKEEGRGGKGNEQEVGGEERKNKNGEDNWEADNSKQLSLIFLRTDPWNGSDEGSRRRPNHRTTHSVTGKNSWRAGQLLCNCDEMKVLPLTHPLPLDNNVIHSTTWGSIPPFTSPTDEAYHHVIHSTTYTTTRFTPIIWNNQNDRHRTTGQTKKHRRRSRIWG